MKKPINSRAFMLMARSLRTILLMAVFMLLLSIENKPLLRLSRTMGTSVITFVVVGLLFLSIYGKFDVGRRKSKPITNSIFMILLPDCDFSRS